MCLLWYLRPVVKWSSWLWHCHLWWRVVRVVPPLSALSLWGVDKMYQFLLCWPGRLSGWPDVLAITVSSHSQADQHTANTQTGRPIMRWGWAPAVKSLHTSHWGLGEPPFPSHWRPRHGPRFALKVPSLWSCLTSANRRRHPEYSARKQRSCMKDNFKGRN